MKNYEITINDKKIINDLIKISHQIEDLYGKLITLEQEKKEESLDYNKYIEYLKLVIDIENDLYEQLFLTPKKCEALIEYLLAGKVPEYFTNNLNAIIKQDFSYLSIRRILINLGANFESFYAKEKDQTPFEQQLLEFLSFMGILDIETYKENQKIKRNSINSELEFNLLSTFLVFIQNDIDNHQDIRDILIKTKYQISFLYKKIENNFLNSLSFPQYLMISDDLSLLEIKTKTENYNYIKTIKYTDLINDFILNTINDDKVKTKYKYFNLYYIYLLSKASIILLDEDIRKDVIDKLKINLEKYVTSNKKNCEIAYSIFKYCLEDIDNEINKGNIILLKNIPKM